MHVDSPGVDDNTFMADGTASIVDLKSVNGVTPLFAKHLACRYTMYVGFGGTLE